MFGAFNLKQFFQKNVQIYRTRGRWVELEKKAKKHYQYSIMTPWYIITTYGERLRELLV